MPRHSKPYVHRRGSKRKTGAPRRKCSRPASYQKNETLAKTFANDLQWAEGNISRAAWKMNISRSVAYRMVRTWGLWPLVNELRKKKYEAVEVADGLLQLAKMSLRG